MFIWFIVEIRGERLKMLVMVLGVFVIVIIIRFFVRFFFLCDVGLGVVFSKCIDSGFVFFDFLFCLYSYLGNSG